MNQILSSQNPKITSAFLCYLWLVLDHMFHENSLNNDDKEFILSLTYLRKLLQFVNGFDNEIALLNQKLDLWGIENENT